MDASLLLLEFLQKIPNVFIWLSQVNENVTYYLDMASSSHFQSIEEIENIIEGREVIGSPADNPNDIDYVDTEEEDEEDIAFLGNDDSNNEVIIEIIK